MDRARIGLENGFQFLKTGYKPPGTRVAGFFVTSETCPVSVAYKRVVFYEQYFLGTLYYSIAMLELSSVGKITDFMEKHDFH